MKIGKLAVSYPFGKFKVLVTHFTERKSTAIEWGILELINKTSKNNALNNISISDIFEEILKINDADLLIKPCLIDLEDLEAITVNNLSDHTMLSDIMMSDIALTTKGEELQKRGLLPGIDTEDTVEFTYDLYKNKLINPKNLKLSEKSSGKELLDIENNESLVFPVVDIRETLENSKKNGKYQWLQETTNINYINNIDTIVMWKNENKDIEIKDGTIVQFVDTKDNDRVNEFIFTPDILGSHERVINSISPLELENDTKDIFLIKNLESKLKTCLYRIDDPSSSFSTTRKRDKNNSKTIYIDKRFEFDYDNPANINTTIFFNAETFKLDVDKDKIIIELPGTILPQNCILFGGKENVFVGQADFYNNFGNGVFKLGYSKKNVTIDEKATIIAIIDSYMDIDPRIISLGASKNQEIVIDKLSNNIKKLSILDDKIERISSILKLSNDLYGKVINTTELYKELFFNELIEGNNFKEFKDVEETYKKYKEHEVKLNDFKVTNYINQEIISAIKYTKTHEDIVALRDLLFAKKKGQRIDELKPLYNNDVVCDIYRKFKKDEKIYVITSIESHYNKMKDIVNTVKECLKDIDMDSHINNKVILSAIVANKENIKQLKNSCLNWEECVSILDNYIDVEVQLLNACDLHNIFENMKKVKEELAIFTQDESIKYKNVLVFDTCTLLDYNDKLEFFTKDNLVVIPTVALSELDNHKKSDDDKIAYNARAAIRQIHDLGERIRIENSNEDLLPKELINTDTNNADNDILSVAIKYIVKGAILVTEDINLRNKAMSQNVISKDLDDTYRLLKPREKNTDKKSNKKNDKKNNNKKNKKQGK